VKMVEEFDAIQSLDLPGIFILVTGILLLGILLEVMLRFGRRWALARHYTWLYAVLSALIWQALFWTFLLGATPAVLQLIETLTDWQPSRGLIPTLLSTSLTIVVVRLINGLLRIMTATTPSASVTLLNNVLTGVGALVAMVIIAGYLFNLSAIVLLLAIVGGVTGLTVVFQEPLNNLVSGVSLTVSDRLTPGDWVRLPSGVEGFVRDIQWDVTMVQQFANNLIIIPNRVMTEAELINYDRPESELIIRVAVGVHYDSDLAHVERVAVEEAIETMTEINGEPPATEPVVRFNAFADSSINFMVVMWAKNYATQFPLTHEFIKRLHQRFKDEGIVIPFPIRTLDIPPDLTLTVASQTPQANVDRQAGSSSNGGVE
jgi:small-conductance mechanosensitive channel